MSSNPEKGVESLLEIPPSGKVARAKNPEKGVESLEFPPFLVSQRRIPKRELKEAVAIIGPLSDESRKGS